MAASIINLTLALLAGSGIGILYFSMLWWTVKELPNVRNKTTWILGTLLVRIASVLFLFYMVMGGKVERLIACMLGFIAMRIVFSRKLGPAKNSQEG